MEFNEEESRYKEIITLLNKLQQVNAPENFEADLMRKINLGYLRKQPLFWERFFVPSRLIPAMALGIAVLIIVFSINLNDTDAGNPLLSDPRVREDIISSNDLTKSLIEEKINEINNSNETDALESSQMARKNNSLKREKDKSSLSGAKRSNSYNMQLSKSNSSYYINKAGLNFRQVNLLPSERIKVSELKQKMEEYIQKMKN